MKVSNLILSFGVLLFGLSIGVIMFIQFREERPGGEDEPGVVFVEVKKTIPNWVWAILGLSLFIILGSIALSFRGYYIS